MLKQEVQDINIRSSIDLATNPWEFFY